MRSGLVFLQFLKAHLAVMCLDHWAQELRHVGLLGAVAGGKRGIVLAESGRLLRVSPHLSPAVLRLGLSGGEKNSDGYGELMFKYYEAGSQILKFSDLWLVKK